jgi:hypothetical protein
MQRLIMALLMTTISALVIPWTGCGPKAVYTGNSEPSTEDVWESIKPITLPDGNPDYIYGTGIGKSRDLGTAVDDAMQMARNDMASQLEAKVSALFKHFREEVGVGEDSELLAMASVISKDVVSQALKGAEEAGQAIKKEDDSHHFYLVMKLHIKAMNVAVVDRVKNEKDLYAQYRSSRTFRELEREVEEYRKQRESDSE